jgi:hypothetical protein
MEWFWEHISIVSRCHRLYHSVSSSRYVSIGQRSPAVSFQFMVTKRDIIVNICYSYGSILFGVLLNLILYGVRISSYTLDWNALLTLFAGVGHAGQFSSAYLRKGRSSWFGDTWQVYLYYLTYKKFVPPPISSIALFKRPLGIRYGSSFLWVSSCSVIHYVVKHC